MTASVLDDVAGLGPVRKKARLRHFKSFKNLRAATLDEIKTAHVVPDEGAEELFRVLARYNGAQAAHDAAAGEATEGTIHG